MTTIILTVLSVVAVIALVGFIFWFICRTPDNLRGFYGIPVIILGIGAAVFLVAFMVTHLLA